MDIARDSSGLAKQGSITDQMLGQGTKKLNREHGYDGSGWGSEQSGLARVVEAQSRLGRGSVRQGSSARAHEAKTEVQARARMHRATGRVAKLAAQSGREQLR